MNKPATNTVHLVEITEDTINDILNLKVTPQQEKFVASNAVSIAQAHFSKTAWFRAIYANDQPVGFIMLDDNEKKPEYFLWRLMIDARFQGKGYAKQAVLQLIDYVKTRPNGNQLYVSYVPGTGGPEKFYQKLGFKATGEWDEDEKICCLALN
ncbi:MAG: GNAT family N-acetyltransferase [Spirochaetes bacterium]|nr:GNAT family N-acetyltransferase [Spirochaetota bacterium]